MPDEFGHPVPTLEEQLQMMMRAVSRCLIRKPRGRLTPFGLLTILLPLLAGCGGGGGGGGTNPPPGATGRASGLVKQSATGRPVAGALVAFASRQGTTDAQGQYSIDAIPVGTTQFRVEAGGFAAVDGTLPAAITTGENTVPDVLLQLSVSDTAPGVPFSIQGRVTLAGQSNAGGVAIVALDPGTQTPVDQTQTGADGRYTLWVPPGSYRLRASRSGYTPQERDITVADVNQSVTADFNLVP
jgi:hypothetical protein